MIEGWLGTSVIVIASEEIQLLYAEPKGIHQRIVLNFHSSRIGNNRSSQSGYKLSKKVLIISLYRLPDVKMNPEKWKTFFFCISKLNVEFFCIIIYGDFNEQHLLLVIY